MKNILKSMLAIAFMATLSGYANAQNLSRLCFQTGTSTQSCQPVTVANPLPTTASLAVTSLNVSGPFNVTVTNTAALPVIVSNPNGLGGSGSVTITNTAAAPVIVSTANGFGGGSGTGPYNVTLTNTVATPAIVTCTNCGSSSISSITVLNQTMATAIAVTGADIHTIATTTGPTSWGGATLSPANQGAAVVSCTNCGAASVTGPFNVTITNTSAVPVIVSNPNGFGTFSGGALSVTVTNIADGVDVTLGAKADSALTTSGSSGSLIAFMKGVVSLLSTLNTNATSPIVAGTNAIGSVTCTNCTANSGPFNVTVTNTVTVGAHNVSITNTPAVT